jgi:hypothetical protein
LTQESIPTNTSTVTFTATQSLSSSMTYTPSMTNTPTQTMTVSSPAFTSTPTVTVTTTQAVTINSYLGLDGSSNTGSSMSVTLEGIFCNDTGVTLAPVTVVANTVSNGAGMAFLGWNYNGVYPYTSGSVTDPTASGSTIVFPNVTPGAFACVTVLSVYQTNSLIPCQTAIFDNLVSWPGSGTNASNAVTVQVPCDTPTQTATPALSISPTPTTPLFQTFTVTPTMTGCGKVNVFNSGLPLNPVSAGVTAAGMVFGDGPYDSYCSSATYNIMNLNFTAATTGNLLSQIEQVQLWQGGVGGTLLGTTSFSGSGFSITGSFGNPTFTLAYVFSPTASGVVQTTITYINGDQNGGSIVGVNLPVASVPLTVVAGPTNTPTVTSTSTATPTMTYSFTSTLMPTGTPGVCSNGGVVSNWGGTLLGDPEGIAVDSSKNVYVGNTDGGYVYKISTSGVASLLAGGGAGTTTNGPGTIASFGSPSGLAVDSLGNVYVADYNNFSTVREISPAGVVSTFAGQAGVTGFLNGPASIALFNTPRGVAVDSFGNVYVADYNNSMVREISTAGTVSTYATVPFPSAITIDTFGNFYVLNGLGFIKITSGSAAATIAAPSGMNFGIAVDSCGDLFTASYSSNLIWETSPAGASTTLAGGTEGSGNGTGTGASFGMPWGVAVDSSGTVYVADDLNQIVRKIQ